MERFFLYYIATFSIIFIYNLMLFAYAAKILQQPSQIKIIAILFSLINSIVVIMNRSDFIPFHLTSFLIIFFLTVEFKLISKAPLSQALFGASVYTLHFLSTYLPILMISSILYETPPLLTLKISEHRIFILFITFTILLLFLQIFKKIIPLQKVIRVSTISPYSESLTVTVVFIISYLSFDMYVLVSDILYSRQVYLLFSILSVSLAIFYYIFMYTANFIELSVYKRQSDAAEEAYDELLIKKQEIKEKITFDTLTGLYNKKFMYEALEELCRNKKENFGLLFVDINGLKYINDTFGHERGDLYIQETAQAITTSIREEDFAGRLGGDEFLVVLRNHMTKNALSLVAERIQKQIAMKKNIYQFPMSASIGLLLVSKELQQQGSHAVVEAVDRIMRERKKSFYAEHNKIGENI